MSQTPKQKQQEDEHRNSKNQLISNGMGSRYPTMKDSSLPAQQDNQRDGHQQDDSNTVSLTKNNSCSSSPISVISGNSVKRKLSDIAEANPEIKKQCTTNSEEEEKNLATVEATKSEEEEIKKMVNYGVPQILAKKLYYYQREGVEIIIKKGGRALIADDMGLGKTIQSIAAMSCFMNEWGPEKIVAKPLLIICPKAVTINWKKEILEWLPDELMKDEHISVIKSGKDTLFRADTKVVILTYGLACTFSSELKDFKCIICDESHYLKNMTCDRTKILLPILRGATRVIMITGTSVFGKPDEIYSTLYALRVTDEKQEQFLSKYDGYDDKTAISNLHILLKSKVMLRRKKESVLSLPPKVRRYLNVKVVDNKLMSEIRCRLSVLQRSNGHLGEHAKVVFPQLKEFNKEYGQKSNQLELKKCSGLTKINAVSYMLKTFLKDQSKSSEKVCIFIHHQAVMNGIITGAGLTKNNYILIDGKTSSNDRNNQIERFQTNPDVRVAMLSIQATGVGITLTAAANVWFAEIPWSPAEITQAEDRCHRIGQTKMVNIVYVIAKDTFDEVLWSYLWKQKYKITEEIIEGQKNQTHNVEKIEFEDWLKE